MYGVLQEKPRIWIVGKYSEEIQVIRVQWGPTGEMLSDLNYEQNLYLNTFQNIIKISVKNKEGQKLGKCIKSKAEMATPKYALEI